MDKFIKDIAELANKIDLNKRFNWDSWLLNFEANELFSSDEKKKILEHDSVLDKNIALKRVLNEKFKNTSNTLKSNLALSFWYIQKWGGINNFKEANSEILEKAIVKSSKKEYISSIDKISSLSKITSIVDIENQVIYDSRVVYAFNWLILKRFDGNLKFFPMPNGRSSVASNFDIGTLINFKFHRRFHEKDLYIEPSQAYEKFCKMFKVINSAVYSDYKNEPFRLEMLLFTAMDKEIFEDIKQSIKISL